MRKSIGSRRNLGTRPKISGGVEIGGGGCRPIKPLIKLREESRDLKGGTRQAIYPEEGGHRGSGVNGALGRDSQKRRGDIILWEREKEEVTERKKESPKMRGKSCVL